MTSELGCDVLVVGFGPVGKLLAIQLGRAGHRVVVVDRQPGGYPLPRAVTHDSEFARALQSIGLPPTSIPDVVEPYDELYRWTNADGQTLVEVDWSGFGPSGWYNTYFFHQPSLEDRMEALVHDLPNVTVLRGWDACHHEPLDGGVEVTMRGWSAEGGRDLEGEPRTVSAAYVIGADGANSVVERWIGSDWHDLGYFYDWLVVDVAPDPSLRFPHLAAQSCDPARPATMVPGGPGRRRWEFMRLPGESREELNQTQVAWSLLEPYGINAGNAELERHSVYTFQAGWATLWRRDRLLIAGDAAHLMPPFAGQGLGAGVRDAMNVSWKLDAVLRGLADASILDTYGVERIPHVASFIDFSMGLGRVICITDRDEALARDVRLMAEWEQTHTAPAPPRPRLGPGVHVGEHGGTLSPQGWVGSAREPLDDVLGGAGLLLVRDSRALSGLTPEQHAHLAGLGVAVCAIPDLNDVEGTYEQWLDRLDVAGVLVRQDFYVFGTAATEDDVPELVGAFLAALGQTAAAR